MRLRQVVLAAADLDATVATLRDALPLGPPWADPAVGLFGLRNAVMPLGDAFVEVVQPVRADAPAARWTGRGYMVLVQVPDVAAVRARAAALGVREAWSVDLADISATHLHPADTGGTLLSVDEPRPPASWRWGGPAWSPAPGGALAGATVGGGEGVAARWRGLLGGEVPGVRFAAGDGLQEVLVEGLASPVAVGGVRFRPPG